LERGAPAPLSVPLIDDFGVAEHRIQAERPGPHEQLRRAVDCAPYLKLRLRVFALKMRTHGAMRPYQRNKILLSRATSPRRQVGVAVQLSLCFGARPFWPQCYQGAWSVAGAFLGPGGSRAVAAPVRARTVGFRPRRRVSMTHPGAPLTARPTDSLRFCGEP
jgi:hypothetical protein